MNRCLSLEEIKDRYESLQMVESELFNSFWGLHEADSQLVAEKFETIRELMTQICVHAYRLEGVENMVQYSLTFTFSK